MKNANSRFVRVLAIVLVVLMVVPAALVGCGSNKANNAAISEALADAAAAKKEAEEAKAAAEAAAAKAAEEAAKALEEAKAAADAAAAKAAEEAAKALEEANKKAEEALKAAEEAQKALEEAAKTTAAPATTDPVPTEDKEKVSAYAYEVLNNHSLDFLKTYYMYAKGATEEDLEDEDYKPAEDAANPAYASEDLKAMVKLYDSTVIAIYQADTTDYINQLVSNFVATIKATPTYVELVINAYKNIDFASKYDVIDVVYAYALLQKALADFDSITDADLKADLMEQLNKYGEDEIDVVEAINNEYYRYTGLDTVEADKTVVEDDDILYEEMYLEAKDVIAAVQLVYGGAELDLAKITYNLDIDDLLEDATEAYDKWKNKFFDKADDTELVEHYEAFRQAFVGEEYVLKATNDKAWDATVAASARIEELLKAAVDAEDLINIIKSIAKLNTAVDNADFKYKKYVAKVAEAEAALNAWKAEYNFKDDADGTENDNVAAIIEAKDANAGIYSNYQTNALVINYFDFLEKTASAVNVDAFISASEEELSDIPYNFNFKKYGSAVAAALEWYYGKEKADGSFAGGFMNIKVDDQKAFAGLLVSADDKTDVEPYDVAQLIAIGNVSILTILDDLFDVADVPALFTGMQDSYNNLAKAKKDANDINDDIDELVEMGATLTVLDDYIEIFSADFEKFVDADDDEKSQILTAAGACDILNWADGTTIKVGDDNFNDMINWEALGLINANIEKCMETVVADAAKVALEYITWKAATGVGATYVEDDEQIEFTYGGTTYTFSDLKPAQIDIYSYNRILNVVELEKTLEDLFDSDSDKVVDTLTNYKANVGDDDNELEIALTSIVSYCGEMVAEFYAIAEKGHSIAYTPKASYPIISPQTYSNNDWRYNKKPNTDSTKADVALTKEDMAAVAFLGRTATDYTDAKVIKGVTDTLNSFKLVSKVGYGTSSGTAADTINVWATSFQGAIYSVDPATYIVKNDKDVITGFDSAAYKAALNTAINAMYTKWFAEWLKDSATQEKLTTVINNLAKEHLEYGLWTLEGEFEVDDELYTYTVNSTGKAYALTIYDSSDEKMKDNAISFKYNSVPYIVGFTTKLEDGKLELVPALLPSVEVEGEEDLQTPALPDGYDDIYEFIDVKAKDLVHDVRDYADAIGANYDKFTNKRFGSNSTLDKLTAANIQAFFDAEAKNDFYVAFETLRARMYTPTSATNNAWKSLGTYIDGWAGTTAYNKVTANTVDKTTYDTIATHTKLARDAVYAMTPEANSISDIEKEFNKFATRVKAILAENGYTYTTAIVDGCEQITSITAIDAE